MRRSEPLDKSWIINLHAALKTNPYLGRLRLLAGICLGLVCGAWVFAESSEAQVKEVDKYQIAFDYRFDDLGTAGLSDNQQLPGSAFFSGGRNGVTLGFKKDPVWLRFPTPAISDSDATWLLQIGDPLLDDIRIYQELIDGSWLESQLGDHFPRARDSVDAIMPVLVLSPKLKPQSTIYARVQSKSSMLINISLVTAERFFADRVISFMAYGAMFGIMGAMCLYNLFLFFSLRDYNYLYYVVSIVSTALFLATISGHAPRWLWPDYRAWSEEIFLVIVAFTLMSGLAFCSRFLEAKIYANTMHKIIVALFILAAITIPLSFVTSFQFSVHLTGAVSGTAGTTGIITAAMCLLRGRRSARFYLIAWTGYCVGTVFTAARQHGFVGNNFYTVHGMEIGAVLETILISFALSDRYNELKNAKERAQNEMAESLRRMDKLKDEFLANTSHELRTPLQGIIGLAESMVDGATGALNEAARNNLSMIANSGQRLAALVDDILDFSKMENRELVLNKKPLDLHVVVDVVLRLSAPLAQAKSLELKNDVEGSVSQALGDENRLQQILHNLVGNAVKFTESGSITVSAIDYGDQIRLLVTDTGSGIALEDQERIFEAFEQVEASATRIHGGTGLGLAVTRELVNLHGSCLELTSVPGVGSTFSFMLPVAVDGAVDPRETSGIDVNAPPSRPIHPSGAVTTVAAVGETIHTPVCVDSADRIRILIVDDEPVNQQVMENHLALQNYDVLRAENGMQALELLKSDSQIDLILLDVMMPHLSGFEVCLEIRKTHMATQLPVVMVTARTQMEDLQQGLQVGANDYITKPFSKGELIARIKTHLNLVKINSAYSHFVPHEFLRYLNRESIIDVRLGDNVEMEAAVLVSDIREFTTLSEAMTPDENFAFINDYLALAAPPVRRHGGFIDRYSGDSVMAVFPGGPEHALAATRDTMASLATFNASREGIGASPIKIGVGLHFGRIRLGIVGEHHRRQGDIFADAVNVANRIEGLCKTFGSTVIVSQAFLAELSDPEESLPERRPLGEVPLKGRREPIALFAAIEFDVIESES